MVALDAYLVLEPFEVVENAVTETVVHCLRYEGVGQVPRSHPGQSTP